MAQSRCANDRLNFVTQGVRLACPFFMPTQRADDIAFPHPARLPLGSSWRGTCLVAGHEQVTLSSVELESCNLGYAKSCPRLPVDRGCDAVRFCVTSESPDAISLQFVLETAYLPTAHGFLEYDQRLGNWTLPHVDRNIQRMAECFLQSYLDRKCP